MGRVTKLADEGVPVVINWNGGGLKSSFVAILKRSEKVVEGQKYISFMLTDVGRVAQLASIVPYPGMVKGRYDQIDPVKGTLMPVNLA